MRTYNIFISHSWSYKNNYDSLIDKFNESAYFYFKDYSVPKDDPVHNAPTDWQLEEAIENKMRPCSVILILAGKYATFSKWIKKEIKIANKLNKPIIAIEPWGAQQTSQIVKESANDYAIVKWNSSSIVQAIKEHSL